MTTEPNGAHAALQRRELLLASPTLTPSEKVDALREMVRENVARVLQQMMATV